MRVPPTRVAQMGVPPLWSRISTLESRTCSAHTCVLTHGTAQSEETMRRRNALRQDRLTIGYVRVSTQEQADRGFSLDAQRERLNGYAVATGHEPIHEFITDDG